MKMAKRMILEDWLEKYNIYILTLKNIRCKMKSLVELNEFILINGGHNKNIIGTIFIPQDAQKLFLIQTKKK